MPIWACKMYGYYEHDWLDCPECITEYEKWLEDPDEYELTHPESLV
jgi:hypothetical protein